MVLDALSALGVAASVVQVVDFSSKLISKGNEYHKSANGALLEHNELAAAATNLMNLSKALEKSFRTIQAGSEDSSEEASFRIVVEDCRTTASEFIAVLNTFKVARGHKRWKSFRQAFKTMWNKDKIEEMLGKLNMIREQLVIHLLVVLSNRSALDFERAVANSKRMEGTILDAIQNSNSEVQVALGKLAKDLSGAPGRSKQQIITKWQVSNGGGLMQITENISEAAALEKKRSIEEKLLDSLYFPTISDRRSKIPKAHARTFRWIYDERPTRIPPWTDIVQWLQDHDMQKGLYWVAGKAGSGKSTLMKYLHDDPRTGKYLNQWAGSCNLVTASCFFWNPGTPLQKSLTGLLLTLLHQLLLQSPHLSSRIAPWRWRAYELGAANLDAWTDVELLEMFHKLIKETADSDRICFFIDGLDEFEGDDEKRMEIINLFKSASELPNIKVCLSSRPWLIFRDTFEHGPKLLLEDLTQDDITNYIQNELEEHPRFQVLRTYDPARCSELVFEIAGKAKGVFLWVFLVVRSLRQGLRNEDDVSDLFERLRIIPADLEEYFKQMMTTLDDFYLPQASELFEVALSAPSALSLMTLSFAHVKDLDIIIRANIERMTARDIDIRHQSTARRLNSRCKGLLEVHRSGASEIVGEPTFFTYTVDFLHRTVRDWLMTNDIRRMLRSYLSPSFEPNVSLCMAFLAQIKSLDIKKAIEYDRGREDLLSLLGDFITSFIKTDSKASISAYSLLDEVSRVMPVYYGYDDIRAFPDFYDQRPLFAAWSKMRKWQNPFLFLLLEADPGLRPYIRTRLKINARPDPSSPGRPLLALVLRLHSTGSLDVETIEAMLRGGADPNECCCDKTVWQHFVANLGASSRPRDGSYPAWLEATQLLIEHGAHSDAPAKYEGKAKEYPLAELHHAFGSEEAAKLEAMLPKSTKSTALVNRRPARDRKRAVFTSRINRIFKKDNDDLQVLKK